MNAILKYLHILLIVTLTLGTLTWTTGCSCSSNKKQAAAKKPGGPKKPKTVEEMEAQRRKRDAEREDKPDFEILDLRVMPSDEAVKGNAKPASHVKPGHWFAAIQELRANNNDFPKGDLEAQCIDEDVKSRQVAGRSF